MPLSQNLIDTMNKARVAMGFLSLEAILALADGNNIPDPFSLLISDGVEIGRGNVFMPNVRITRDGQTECRIGDGNLFHGNTVIEAVSGPITIGNHNVFGEGQVLVKANAPGAAIWIGNQGRYVGQISLFGQCDLGHGSQILGDITAISCALGAGESNKHPDPDMRGGVLKGRGVAKNLVIGQGAVMNGKGDFDVPVERQSIYHQ